METRGDDVQVDRRNDEGLVYDEAGGCLRMGVFEAALPVDGGNQAVLEAYVSLVSTCRGARPDTILEVRADDVAGLSAALDLDAADLRILIEEILSVGTDQAVGLIIRLLQHRLVAGAALAAVGAVAAGALALGGGSGTAGAAPAAPARPPAVVAEHEATPAPTTAAADEEAPVVDGPLVETEDGVGLIPPIEEDADGVVLIPAVSIDAPVGAGS